MEIISKVFNGSREKQILPLNLSAKTNDETFLSG